MSISEMVTAMKRNENQQKPFRQHNCMKNTIPNIRGRIQPNSNGTHLSVNFLLHGELNYCRIFTEVVVGTKP